jgi:hypothetical protein
MIATNFEPSDVLHYGAYLYACSCEIIEWVKTQLVNMARGHMLDQMASNTIIYDRFSMKSLEIEVDLNR